jgi:ribosomal protein L29
MERHKLSADEIRGLEPARLKELGDEVRSELCDLRMDIYTAKSQNAGKLRGLRKSLARVLTITCEKKRTAASH